MFSSIVKRLPSLPPEVVHKVLSDLRLSRILHLICAHDIPYIDVCVSSHFHIGKLLPASRLPQIKQFFSLYLDIIKQHRHPGLHHPHISLLECDAQLFLNRGGTPDDIVYHITSVILIKLSAYDPYRFALSPFSPDKQIPSLYETDTTDVVSLRHFFDTLLNAEATMNKIKSNQLRRLAQLISENPKTLKVVHDQSQEARRSDQHRIDQLLVLSEKMVKYQILDKSSIASRIFASHNIFLVPYDRLLRGFLKVIRRISRTKYTPYAPSEKKDERVGGLRQPQFNTAYSRIEFQNIQDRIQPMDERELQWLEAFLKVCRYMSHMDVIWNNNTTVAEYWAKHFSP
ncbi:hypothetical protein AMATHDRAFT_138927 [Amanita thiersii Skay4041]|uniref:Uncharacterized protein n=1 Tax=Amanita thiersii Skay4041 TaxID=703135 RepID=A0A2A9NPV1_9AGAR|nr:hypothetical protein AMATHDRAFT_138927 [Amanita thiersii Skay4041]